MLRIRITQSQDIATNLVDAGMERAEGVEPECGLPYRFDSKSLDMESTSDRGYSYGSIVSMEMCCFREMESLYSRSGVVKIHTAFFSLAQILIWRSSHCRRKAYR